MHGDDISFPSVFSSLQINIRETPFQGALAAVFLPGLLRDYLRAQSFDPEDHTEIQFSFFGSSGLFKVKVAFIKQHSHCGMVVRVSDQS